jgi:hypothetical protein
MKAKNIITALLILGGLTSCADDGEKESDHKVYHYVNPTIDYRGRFRKGHFRKDFNTDPNALKNRARSRYYYQTRGKYMRRSRKK